MKLHRIFRNFLLAVIPIVGLVISGDNTSAQQLPELSETTITSTLDGKAQPIRFWAPETARQKPTVLFVFLHSWSSDYRQDNSKWHSVAVEQGWIYLHPNFRGVNRTPQACGSRFARQDILDAMDFASRTFNVDRERIYLCGVSGGGHMSMLMAGHHPDRFSAVSAWVGISNLAEWYHFHVKDGQPQKYAQMILGSFGSSPGTSKEVDAEYRDRSPLFHIHQVGDLPVDILAGVNDGHTGSVPVSHSLRAFNQIAKAHKATPVSEAEMDSLWTSRRLQNPRPSDQQKDSALGRTIHLRRTAGASRVTIFDGGHESVPAAAVEWLKRHRRKTTQK